MAHLGYRRDIDGLRTVAVMPVVLGHAGIAGFSGGFIGVDIFFVISGYLISSILLREIGEGRFSLLRFYERRVRRILPALFAMLLACLIGGWFILSPDLYMGLGQSTLATLLFSSNIWFWSSTGDYFGSAAELEPLLHTWSLAVEEQFYLFFPLLLCAWARWPRRRVFAGIALLSLLSFAAAIWATEAAPFANFFLTPFRTWELGLGAILALWTASPPAGRRGSELIAAAGLGAIVASILLLTAESPFPGLTALPACAGAFAIIWTGGHHRTLVSRALSTSPFVWIGLISYSLYLWHWPVLVIARVFLGRIELSTSIAFAAIGVAMVMGWASWRFVERPFRGRQGGMTIFTMAGGAGAALALASGLLVIQGGFPDRVKGGSFATYTMAVARTQHQLECLNRPVEEGLCELGAPSAPRQFLLWGDSHAAAMLPGIELWLGSNDAGGLAALKQACAPLLGVIRVSERSGRSCGQFNNEVLAFVEARPEITTVILAARWAFAAEGTRAPGESGRPLSLGPLDPAMADAMPAGNAARMEEGLSALVRRLRNAGRKVLVLEGVPEIGFSVPQTYLASTLIGIDPPKPPTRTAFLKRNARANDIIARLTADPGVTSVSIADLMCEDRCLIEADGSLLYRDDDHLSIFASERFVPLLLNAGLAER